jgi:hypothetical protein
VSNLRLNSAVAVAGLIGGVANFGYYLALTLSADLAVATGITAIVWHSLSRGGIVFTTLVLTPLGELGSNKTLGVAGLGAQSVGVGMMAAGLHTDTRALTLAGAFVVSAAGVATFVFLTLQQSWEGSREADGTGNYVAWWIRTVGLLFWLLPLLAAVGGSAHLVPVLAGMMAVYAVLMFAAWLWLPDEVRPHRATITVRRPAVGLVVTLFVVAVAWGALAALATYRPTEPVLKRLSGGGVPALALACVAFALLAAFVWLWTDRERVRMRTGGARVLGRALAAQVRVLRQPDTRMLGLAAADSGILLTLIESAALLVVGRVSSPFERIPGIGRALALWIPNTALVLALTVMVGTVVCTPLDRLARRNFGAALRVTNLLGLLTGLAGVAAALAPNDLWFVVLVVLVVLLCEFCSSGRSTIVPIGLAARGAEGVDARNAAAQTAKYVAGFFALVGVEASGAAEAVGIPVIVATSAIAFVWFLLVDLPATARAWTYLGLPEPSATLPLGSTVEVTGTGVGAVQIVSAARTGRVELEPVLLPRGAQIVLTEPGGRRVCVLTVLSLHERLEDAYGLRARWGAARRIGPASWRINGRGPLTASVHPAAVGPTA